MTLRWICVFCTLLFWVACNRGQVFSIQDGDEQSFLDAFDAGADIQQQDAFSDAGDSIQDAGFDGLAGDDSAEGDDGGSVDDGGNQSFTCQDPKPQWLLCEDFESGDGDFDAFLSQSDFIGGVGVDDRGRIRLDSSNVHSGQWSVYMPAEAGSGYKGAGLDWRDCIGEQRTNCSMHSHEVLYFRAWIRFADDHRLVHHFLNIGGSQPDDYWYHGTAGCLPSGELAMGTTVDFHKDNHETFFYTYFPEMGCDTRCERYADVQAICDECASKGLPTCDEQPQCCWGNEFAPDPPVAFPVGRWFCFEMMMKANTPLEHDGEMAYWIDGRLIHSVDGMMWRTIPELALNRVRLQHYITTDDAGGHSNRVWFDDVVVSTEPIGCR